MPIDPSPVFQQELELCRHWGFQFKVEKGCVRLGFDQEQLVPLWIEQETPAIAWDRLEVIGFLSAASTNREALHEARKGAPAGTLVYAEEQTAGKGRKDRPWFSPAGSGLYFSLVLRPRQPRRTWPLLNHAASVALAETLNGLSGWGLQAHPLRVDLKWPNDVLLSGKKCAGILLEACSSESIDSAAVIGIGVNVHPRSFPEPMAFEATCIDERAQIFVPRRRLLVDILRRFQRWYLIFEQGKRRELLEEWKAYCSMWKDAEIWISDGAGRRAGVTCGIDENGALLVRVGGGRVETVLAGDVSIRKIGERDK